MVEVWAPYAHGVDLVVGADRSVMQRRGDRGWFSSSHDLRPGTDYSFALDGGDLVPDPRSHWQPSGVFGASRVVDHAAFDWTDDGWRGVPLAGSTVYELHVGTFSPGGTFDGAIERLHHLVELGIDVIEVMPANAFDGERGWGYDGVLLYAVHEPYGGPDGFKRFVDAAHARGLGVFLDVVYNHFGPSGNHLGSFGPYTSDRHQTPWGDAVNLDGPHSPDVRRFFIDNACHWLRHYHLDGLRLDAVHALVDDSEPHFLTELTETVDALAASLHRSVGLVAEYPHTEPLAVCAREAGGHGLHAVWRDEVHHAVHAALTGERDGYYAPFGSMAAIADALTGPKDDLPRSRFLACTQNHDQVGNRAKGERLVDLTGIDGARTAVALVLCGPFTPMLFMGEEWAASTPFPYFCGPREPGLDDAVRRGRRDEFAGFGWDPSAIPDPVAGSTFESAVLRWSEINEPRHAAMLDWYRALLQLRREHPALADPRPDSVSVDVDEASRTLTMNRSSLSVVANLGPDEHVVAMARGERVRLSSKEGVHVENGRVTLPAGSVAVLV